MTPRLVSRVSGICRGPTTSLVGALTFVAIFSALLPLISRSAPPGCRNPDSGRLYDHRCERGRARLRTRPQRRVPPKLGTQPMKHTLSVRASGQIPICPFPPPGAIRLRGPKQAPRGESYGARATPGVFQPVRVRSCGLSLHLHPIIRKLLMQAFAPKLSKLLLDCYTKSHTNPQLPPQNR